jgi:hypothetical protein
MLMNPLSIFSSFLKALGQFVKLLYDFLVVGLNILPREFIHLLLYLFAGHGDWILAGICYRSTKKSGK